MRAASFKSPFFLPEQPFASGIWGGGSGLTDTTGRTVRNLALNPAVKNLVLLICGQSNMCGVASAVYSPTNGSVLDNFNIYDASTYAAVDPLLGCQYLAASLGGDARGNIGTRVGDALITAGKFARVLLVPTAIGGTQIEQWATGNLAARIPSAIRRLADRGIVEGPNVTFAMMWGQGENDHATAQADYEASFGKLAANVRAAGMNGRIFVARQTRMAGVNSATIRAAQAAVVNNGAGIYAGPDADAITAGRYGDGTHFDTAGLASLSAAWVSALGASGAPF